MYIKTVKLSRTVFALAVVTIGAAAVLAAAGAAKKLSGSRRVYKVQTEQQRQALISELGWQTGDKPSSHKTITIPEQFDDVYEGYNALQKEQGFDLAALVSCHTAVNSYDTVVVPEQRTYLVREITQSITVLGEDDRLLALSVPRVHTLVILKE